MKKKIPFLFLALTAISVLFVITVIAVHTVTVTNDVATSTTVKEDVSNRFNISVNLTDAGSAANITEVIITLPLNFEFKSGTNATSAIGSAFVNSSGGNSTVQQVLNWTNRTYLINNSKSMINFLFNATATPSGGSYSINVSTRNQSTVISTLITVTINSSLSNINFTSPGVGGGSRSILTINRSASFVPINVTATNSSAFAIDTYIIRLYNVTENLIQNSTGGNNTGSFFANFTSLSDGTYFVNATVNDTTGNTNYTETMKILLDTTSPSISLTRSSSSTDTRIIVTVATEGASTSASGIVPGTGCSINNPSNSRSISGSDSSWTVTDTDLVCGTSYSYTVTCTDHVGNSNSGTSSFSTDDCGGGGGSSSSSGSSSTAATWTNTFVTTTEQVSSGYTKDLSKNERVKVSLNKEIHYVGVTGVTSSGATISVSSTPQEATLKIGETKKFDSNGDGYYDLKVTLNSVSGTKANITVMSVYEKVPSAEATQPETSTSGQSGGETTSGGIASSLGSSKLWWIIGAVLVIVIIVGIIVAKKKRY